MRKLLFLAVMAITFVGCTKEETTSTLPEGAVMIKVEALRTNGTITSTETILVR